MKRIFTQLTASLLLTMAGVLIFPISAPAATDDETKSYQIKMNVNEGGKVVTSATQAPEGSSVSLWTYVKKGYQRETFTVTTSDGQDVELIPIVGTSTTELLTNGKCDGTFGGWEKTDGGSGWGVNHEKDAVCWASSYYTCTLWQTFNLEDYGISDSEIDNGNVSCSASAEMTSIWEKNGNGARVAEVKVEMQDASGNVINTVTVLNDLSYIENWKTYSATFTLAAGTRILRYVVRGQDAINWNGRFGPAYRNLSLTITSTGSESGFTMPAADVTVNAVFSKEGGGTVVTPEPTITYETTDDYCLITATGEGMIVLYVNDTEVENPCMWDRTDQDQEITVTAVDEINGNVVTEAIWIPKKEGGSAFTGKVCIDNIYYNLNGDNMTAEVTYNKQNVGYLKGEVVIPEKVTYEGVEYTVTSIGEYAFKNNNSISPSSVTIPGTVTTIGKSAFEDCRLTIVEIPEGVTTIGEKAFYSCTSYQDLILPSTLTSIGSQAFGWSNQTRIFSAMENPCELPEDAFYEYRFETTTLYVPVGTKSKYQNTNYWSKFQNIVEGEMKKIAVADGNSLYYILYSDSKTAEVIQMGVYSGKIDIPEKVTSKGVEYTVTSIGEEAFYECENLTSVTIPKSVTTIGDNAFEGCSGLTSITIPGSVTTIGNYAFDSCSGITTVTIPKSVTTLGYNPFWGCSGLTSMKVESGNAKYDSRNGCNAIIEKATNTLVSGCKNTTIPNTVTSIGEDAFGGLETLTSIDIPNSVTSIESYAFYRCSGLTSISLSDGLTSIGEDAFNGCQSLTSISLPKSLTSIGEWAFFSCGALVSMEIPEGVTKIGLQILSYCNALTSVTIPASVLEFADYVFYGSEALKEIHCHISEPSAISEYVFDPKNYSTATLYVPKGTKEKYQSTASWNLFTNIEEEEVTGIEKILNGMPATVTIYDMKGRKINPSQVRKGHVYIVNGKKTVVR